MKVNVDVLIIGQGLAGSLLAWELIQRNIKVFIIDNGRENASKIAAGLINPVTGMRFVKSTDVDFLLPVAKDYYRNLEIFFKQSFYIEKSMWRLLKNDKEIKNAQKRLNNSDYTAYLEGIFESEQFGKILKQQQTAYLLTEKILKFLKDFFIRRQCYQQAEIDFNAINLASETSYQSIKAKQIIFCEGYLAKYNPWFSYLPFQLVKGEILSLQSKHILPKTMLNYGQWMIPLDDYNFRTGATFEREIIDTQKTAEAQKMLQERLHHVLPETLNAKLIKQQANVRPCTLDKQPFIGFHSKHSQLAIFNGFGAKGSLQIPYYAQHFAKVLLKQSALSATVDIARYRTHFN